MSTLLFIRNNSIFLRLPGSTLTLYETWTNNVEGPIMPGNKICTAGDFQPNVVRI